MRLSLSVMVIGLFVFSIGGHMAMAQQDANGQQIMTPASGDAANAPTDSRQSHVDALDLKLFEAAAGDLSICGGNEDCSKNATQILDWLCAANVCDGTDKSKRAMDCFGGASDQFKDVQDRVEPALCYLIKTPSAEGRREVMALIPDQTESRLVEEGAYLLALKGSATSCEQYIKNYVGAYGPQWRTQLYRELSGCRILAHTSTREQEEKDFYTWFGVLDGEGTCSSIVDPELRSACSAPDAASPAQPISW